LVALHVITSYIALHTKGLIALSEAAVVVVVVVVVAVVAVVVVVVVVIFVVVSSLASYLEKAGFEFRFAHSLSKRSVSRFIQSNQENVGQHIKIGHNRFLPHPC
jgi:Na+/glutamate symporter